MSNKNIPTKTLTGLAALLFALGCTSMAFAQGDPSEITETHTSYTIGYYQGANSGLPDAQMHIVNPGSTGGFGNPNESQNAPTQGGDLCANIYVFNEGQQLISCCSCKISPNGMQGFSLATDIVSNPLTSMVPTAGTIEVISSRGGGFPAGLPPAGGATVGSIPSNRKCDAGTYYPAGGALETWITHVSTLTPAGEQPIAVTESQFVSAPLNEDAYVRLVELCFAIEAPASSGGIGSGAGVCKCDPEKAY